MDWYQTQRIGENHKKECCARAKMYHEVSDWSSN